MHSLRCTMVQYRVVIYNEIGHNPRDLAKKKSVSMEEKRLAKVIRVEPFTKNWN